MRILDSMFKSDEFVKLYMEKDRSYFDLSLKMGNGIFSAKNNAINAGQAQTNKLYYTPSVSYNHKSGLGISVNGSFASDNGSLRMYQYAVTPSYVFSNKKFAAAVSYTRYIEGAYTAFQTNPFKNDLYASAVYKKTWIEPGLAVGFSFGKQTEYFDTAFWFFNRVVHIRDTITTRLGGLSATLSAGHHWDFYQLLGKKDAMQVQTSLLLSAGSQQWNITHSNSLITRRPLVQNYLKNRYGDGSSSSKFNIQSASFSAGITYYIGKFYLQPQIYFDYYLPPTTEKRLTSLFSATAGFYFY